MGHVCRVGVSVWRPFLHRQASSCAQSRRERPEAGGCLRVFLVSYGKGPGGCCSCHGMVFEEDCVNEFCDGGKGLVCIMSGVC